MSIPVSVEVKRMFSEAEDMAKQTNKPFHTGYLLLAMYTVPNKALSVLEERKVDEDALIGALKALRGQAEPLDSFARIHGKMQQVATGCDAPLCSSIHLLIALCRITDALAYRILQKAGVDPARVRTTAISRLSGGPTPRDSWLPRPNAVRATSPSLPGAPAPQDSQSGADGNDSSEPRTHASMFVEPARLDALPAVDRYPFSFRETAEEPDDEADAEPDSKYALDPDAFPTLSALGRNLSVEADAGRIDPLVGRSDQVEQILDILHKRRANNACLIGEPGVGKTAIVEGLARALVTAEEDGTAGTLAGRVVVELNTASLLAGTSLRGSFAERLGAIKDEVKRADGKIIIFIDEIHTLIGAGAGDGPLDASNDLKAALARGEFPCIGATTIREYKKYIESDAALERRFHPVHVPEPSFDETLHILSGIIEHYEVHHGVTYRREALEAAIRLSSRYITDRCLPDKAINLIDLSGSRVKRGGRTEVLEADVAQVVSSQTDVPLDKLLMRDSERLLRMESFLQQKVVGHAPQLGRIARVIQRNYAGFNSSRPMGSFLFLGPTGVGKTETVRALAEFLFQNRDAVARFDMSEYSESHAVAKLIGAPPGYVGHDAGGQLTEALHKRPYQIILLDEIEKAHPDVWNLLLQLLDEGRLTDGRGKRVIFSNTVVIMTSNLGAQAYEQASARPIGFGAASSSPADGREEAMLGAAAKVLPPELWNRIEERLVFAALSRDDVSRIARLLVEDSSKRLEREKDIRYEVDDEVVSYLIDHGGFDVRYGARPMRQTIQRLVEAVIAEEILKGAITEGARLRLTVRDGRVVADPATESTS